MRKTMSDLNSDSPYQDDIDKAREMYFFWLCSVVRADEEFVALCDVLHRMEFTWTVDQDSNRFDDGIALRQEWYDIMEESGYFFPLDALDGPCSVLEMLVGLAERCERQILGDPSYGNRTYQWFWEMVRNFLIGNAIIVEDCTDENVSDGYLERVIDSMERVLAHDYAFNGEGGFFPLRYSRVDQRRVELWAQMNQYICENGF